MIEYLDITEYLNLQSSNIFLQKLVSYCFSGSGTPRLWVFCPAVSCLLLYLWDACILQMYQDGNE